MIQNNSKKCSKCNKEYSTVEFNKNKNTKDGFHAWCKVCSKEINAKYYIDNKEKCKAKARASKWKIRNPERVKEAIRKWKKENREYVKEAERKRFRNLRRRALEKIGLLYCVNCGCNKYELLEINHMNGNGHKERRKMQTSKFYLRIVNSERTTEDLNILCRPCNTLHYLELKYGKLPYEIRWNKLVSGG